MGRSEVQKFVRSDPGTALKCVIADDGGITLTLGTLFVSEEDAAGLSRSPADIPEALVVSPHGQCVVETVETLNVPPGVAAFVYPRASLGRVGLLILSPHVSGSFIGPVRMRIVNLSDTTIHLEIGMRLAELYLYDEDENRRKEEQLAAGYEAIDRAPKWDSRPPESGTSVCFTVPSQAEFTWLNEGGVKNLLLYFDEVCLIGWRVGPESADAPYRALLDKFELPPLVLHNVPVARRYNGPIFFEEDEGMSSRVVLGLDMSHLAEMDLIIGKPAPSSDLEKYFEALTALSGIDYPALPGSAFVPLDQRLLLDLDSPPLGQALNHMAERGLLRTKRISRTGPVDFRLEVHPWLKHDIQILLDALLTTEPNWSAFWMGAPPTADRDSSSRPSRAEISPSFIHLTDATSVGIDLSGTPLVEVLEFKAEHRSKLDTYVRNVNAFAAVLSADGTRTEQLVKDRAAELRESVEELSRAMRKRWRPSLAEFTLTAAGTLGAAGGNTAATALSLLGAALSALPDPLPASPFHYLAQAKSRFPSGH